jgi:hypothetical protein
MSSRFSIQNFPAFGMEMTYFSETTEFCTSTYVLYVERSHDCDSSEKIMELQ